MKLLKMPFKVWVHYLLLTGMLFAGFYLGDKYLNLSSLTTWQMFIFWFFVIVISDRLIHKYYLGEN
jgi:hypothetical protein